MVRLLGLIIASAPMLLSCGLGSQGGRGADFLCAGGSNYNELGYCFADIYELVGNSENYCDRDVVTFGYFSKDWSGLRVYPDEQRAARQVVYSGILVRGGDAEMGVLSEAGEAKGVYLEIYGTFKCYGPEDRGAVGVGAIDEVRAIMVADLDTTGKFVKSRTIVLDED